MLFESHKPKPPVASWVHPCMTHVQPIFSWPLCMLPSLSVWRSPCSPQKANLTLLIKTSTMQGWNTTLPLCTQPPLHLAASLSLFLFLPKFFLPLHLWLEPFLCLVFFPFSGYQCRCWKTWAAGIGSSCFLCFQAQHAPLIPRPAGCCSARGNIQNRSQRAILALFWILLIIVCVIVWIFQ